MSAIERNQYWIAGLRDQKAPWRPHDGAASRLAGGRGGPLPPPAGTYAICRYVCARRDRYLRLALFLADLSLAIDRPKGLTESVGSGCKDSDCDCATGGGQSFTCSTNALNQPSYSCSSTGQLSARGAQHAMLLTAFF